MKSKEGTIKQSSTAQPKCMHLTFICPCIANIFAEHNQQDATFLNLFISVRRSTCFRRFFRPSSGAQKLHIQRQVFVRPLLLPAANLDRLTAGSSNGLTATFAALNLMFIGPCIL